MSVTREKSDKDIPQTSAIEIKDMDSEEKSKSHETSKTKDELGLDNINTKARPEKDTDLVSLNRQIDSKVGDANLNISAAPLTELTKPILNDETKDSSKAEDASTSLNESFLTSFKDSDPCSEDMVLRYDDSELSELDKNSDLGNDNCSQNFMDKSNDIIEELDNIIGEDQSNSNLDTNDDSEFMDNKHINKVILPNADRVVGTDLKPPVRNTIPAETILNVFENKSIDETKNITKSQADIIEERSTEVEKTNAEPNISKENYLKICKTSLLGAGDCFISNDNVFLKKQSSHIDAEAMQLSNIAQPFKSGDNTTQSIDENQENASEKIINTVPPSKDDLLISGIEQMDVDEDIAMAKTEPMEVSHFGPILLPIENSTTVESAVMENSKLTTKDAESAIMDTESITSSYETIEAGILESDTSKNINPKITETVDVCNLPKQDLSTIQDIVKELTEHNNLKITPQIEKLNIQAQELAETLELQDNLASIVANIDTIDCENIINEQSSSDITVSSSKYSDVVLEIAANLPSENITASIASPIKGQNNTPLENKETNLLLTESTANPTYSEINEAASPKPINTIEVNILTLPAQKQPVRLPKNGSRESEPKSAEVSVPNTPLGVEKGVEMAIPESVSTTKVTDQLSVDIPMFSSKQSDMSQEVTPQALQLSKHSPDSEDTQVQVAEKVESISENVIKPEDLEIAQPILKPKELDQPTCEIVKSDDTKASESKDSEPRTSEMAQPFSEFDPASKNKTALKTELQGPETPKSITESIENKPENSEADVTACEMAMTVTKSPEKEKSLTKTNNTEPQKSDIVQPSTNSEEMKTQPKKTIETPSKSVSPAIPEEPKLKSPEPSTSKDSESQEMQPDQSDEVPDMTDSLGLLAETFRSMDDGDEQEEDHEEPDDDDGDDGEDDDDFDHDDESSQVPDTSEESNVANSENDHDINLAEPIKSSLLEDAGSIQAVETLSGNAVEAITDIEIEENKVTTEIDLGTLEQEEIKLPKTPEALSDIIAPNEEAVEKVDTTNDTLQHLPKLRAILTENKASLEVDRLTPTKAKKLEISQTKNIVNIVDLEESSSEDDIQEVTRPTESEANTDDNSTAQAPHVAKPVRINTSEITIKTKSAAAVTEPTLVIPEIRVGNVDISTDSKPKCSLEVFNLDSDEDSSGKEKSESDNKLEMKQPCLDTSKIGDCVNPTCDGTSSHYIKANAAILRFYDAKKKRRKRAVVCENCAYHVGSRLENLMEGVKCCDTRLLSLHIERKGDQLVEISDSDSDSETEDKLPNTVGDTGFEFLESKFADMVNSTWIKYNLAARMADAKEEIVAEIEQLEKDSKEIDDMLSSCQKLTDQVRNDLYAAFARPIHHLTPIDVDENRTIKVSPPSNNDDSNSETDGQIRRSKRTRSSKDEPPSKRAAIPLGYKNKTEDSNADQAKDSKDDDIRVVRLSSEAAPPSLPPQGELRRAALRVGMPVYGMRHANGSWSLAVIENVGPADVPNFKTCRVKFENKVKGQFKQLLGRHLAYAEPADVRLTIGTRVIALFIDTSESKKKTSFYSGVIAEVPNPVNVYRYLVFFDDGYAQYVQHADIRVVCETSALVWDEVHTCSREFVKSYLLAYPERPMVRLHAGQSLKTEWNGKWWPSKVIAVDASLVHVHFEADRRTEWIYRGSTRLAPLYLELQAADRPRHRPLHSAATRHTKNMPYVEYTRSNEQEDEKPSEETQQQEQEEIKRQRAVAKKSTMQPFQPQPPPSVHQSPSDSVLSRVVYYTPKAAVKPYKMQAHVCSIKCKRTDVLPLNELRTYNPLARPLLSGWERQIVRYRFRKDVVYRAPCGRRLRNIQELHRYLRDTFSEMSVDLFDFNPQTHCLAEFVLNRCLVSKKDLSHGKENVPVPCVNYYDSSLPEFCSYNTERTPTQGVPLNTDPEFLCGCDCTDDCQDKSKCACWKMTMEGAKTIGMEDTAGYVYKRLLEQVPTGIYECNSRCKCSKTCLNRVAQHPLQLKLQVFKTLNRGWGIRALNDVPKGAFLCVYAGNLLTDATANLDGLNEGDEYLAELDYIEVVEQMKEGYEDDVPDQDKRLDQKSSGSSETSDGEPSEEDDGEAGSELSKDEDFKPDPARMGHTPHVFSKRLRKRSRKAQEGEKEKERDKDKPKDKDGNEEDCITISDDEEMRKPSRFNAEAGMDPNEFISNKRSVRSFFGKDEACYIMDAKVQGNIGRYLNHSCTPNVFVQNVFVDTHDPRFPWVAFFALSHIKAGTELTWNYNYDIGSVPGKVLYCYCGAANCRRRLL